MSNNNNLFNFTQRKNIRSICDDFNQILNQIGQISKFKSDYKIIEKYLIELTNDLPHRLIAIRKQFASLTPGAKQELLQTIISKIRINNPGDFNLRLDVTTIQNFEDEDLLNLIKYCKNYLQRQLYKVASKDIELKVEKIVELQRQIPEFHQENSRIVKDILQTKEIDELRKIILQEKNRYAAPDPKDPTKINKILDFCTKENHACQQKILKYRSQLAELKNLQAAEEQTKITAQNKLQTISRELEELKVEDNLLEKEIYKLQDKAKDNINNLNALKPKFLKLSDLRQEIKEMMEVKTLLLEELRLTSTSLQVGEREICILSSRIDCLSDVVEKNQQLMNNAQEHGIQDPSETVRSIFENILLKQFSEEDDNLLIYRIQEDAQSSAELGTFFSVNDTENNKKNIELVEKSGICKPSITPHTLTSLRSSIIDATIEKHLSCLTDDITFCLYEKIDRKLIDLPDPLPPSKDTDAEIDQKLKLSIRNPLESEPRMYNNPLFKLQRLYDTFDQKKFVDKVEDFSKHAEQTTSINELQAEKQDLELEALKHPQDDIFEIASSSSKFSLETEIISNSNLSNVTDHETLMASLADVEVIIEENLKNAKDMVDLIIETLKEAKTLDPEQEGNTNNPEFFTAALIKLSNELPHKLSLLNSGAKSFF